MPELEINYLLFTVYCLKRRGYTVERSKDRAISINRWILLPYVSTEHWTAEECCVLFQHLALFE